MAYTVYIYDLPLLRFSFESSEKQNGKTKYRGLNRSGIDEERISISWHDKYNERLLPCELLDLHDGTIRAEGLENRTLR